MSDSLSDLDRKTLRALKQHGDDQTLSRHVIYWLFFPTDEQRRSALAEATTMGWSQYAKTLSEEPGEDGTGFSASMPTMACLTMFWPNGWRGSMPSQPSTAASSTGGRRRSRCRYAPHVRKGFYIASSKSDLPRLEPRDALAILPLPPTGKPGRWACSSVG